MTPKEEIIEEVAREGSFVLMPRLWLSHEKAVEELEDMGLITSIADATGNTEDNNCYIYIEKRKEG